MQARRRIVVGVDGSECSDVALRWAADEAEYRGATLVADCDSRRCVRRFA